jgi:hypothetical protein
LVREQFALPDHFKSAGPRSEEHDAGTSPYLAIGFRAISPAALMRQLNEGEKSGRHALPETDSDI